MILTSNFFFIRVRLEILNYITKIIIKWDEISFLNILLVHYNIINKCITRIILWTFFIFNLFLFAKQIFYMIWTITSDEKRFGQNRFCKIQIRTQIFFLDLNMNTNPIKTWIIKPKLEPKSLKMNINIFKWNININM